MLSAGQKTLSILHFRCQVPVTTRETVSREPTKLVEQRGIKPHWHKAPLTATHKAPLTDRCRLGQSVQIARLTCNIHLLLLMAMKISHTALVSEHDVCYCSRPHYSKATPSSVIELN